MVEVNQYDESTQCKPKVAAIADVASQDGSYLAQLRGYVVHGLKRCRFNFMPFIQSETIFG